MFCRSVPAPCISLRCVRAVPDSWFLVPALHPNLLLCLFFSSVAKQRRTSTSSSRAPSPSSRPRTSWSSPTSTRASLPISPSSTRSLCTRRSRTAYEEGTSVPARRRRPPPPRLTTTRSTNDFNHDLKVLRRLSNTGPDLDYSRHFIFSLM